MSCPDPFAFAPHRGAEGIPRGLVHPRPEDIVYSIDPTVTYAPVAPTPTSADLIKVLADRRWVQDAPQNPLTAQGRDPYLSVNLDPGEQAIPYSTYAMETQLQTLGVWEDPELYQSQDTLYGRKKAEVLPDGTVLLLNNVLETSPPENGRNKGQELEYEYDLIRTKKPNPKLMALQGIITTLPRHKQTDKMKDFSEWTDAFRAPSEQAMYLDLQQRKTAYENMLMGEQRNDIQIEKIWDTRGLAETNALIDKAQRTRNHVPIESTRGLEPIALRGPAESNPNIAPPKPVEGLSNTIQYLKREDKPQLPLNKSIVPTTHVSEEFQKPTEVQRRHDNPERAMYERPSAEGMSIQHRSAMERLQSIGGEGLERTAIQTTSGQFRQAGHQETFNPIATVTSEIPLPGLTAAHFQQPGNANREERQRAQQSGPVDPFFAAAAPKVDARNDPAWRRHDANARTPHATESLQQHQRPGLAAAYAEAPTSQSGQHQQRLNNVPDPYLQSSQQAPTAVMQVSVKNDAPLQGHHLQKPQLDQRYTQAPITVEPIVGQQLQRMQQTAMPLHRLTSLSEALPGVTAVIEQQVNPLKTQQGTGQQFNPGKAQILASIGYGQTPNIDPTMFGKEQAQGIDRSQFWRPPATHVAGEQVYDPTRVPVPLVDLYGRADSRQLPAAFTVDAPAWQQHTGQKGPDTVHSPGQRLQEVPISLSAAGFSPGIDIATAAQIEQVAQEILRRGEQGPRNLALATGVIIDPQSGLQQVSYHLPGDVPHQEMLRRQGGMREAPNPYAHAQVQGAQQGMHVTETLSQGHRTQAGVAAVPNPYAHLHAQDAQQGLHITETLSQGHRTQAGVGAVPNPYAHLHAQDAQQQGMHITETLSQGHRTQGGLKEVPNPFAHLEAQVAQQGRHVTAALSQGHRTQGGLKEVPNPFAHLEAQVAQQGRHVTAALSQAHRTQAGLGAIPDPYARGSVQTAAKEFSLAQKHQAPGIEKVRQMSSQAAQLVPSLMQASPQARHDVSKTPRGQAAQREQRVVGSVAGAGNGNANERLNIAAKAPMRAEKDYRAQVDDRGLMMFTPRRPGSPNPNAANLSFGQQTQISMREDSSRGMSGPAQPLGLMIQRPSTPLQRSASPVMGPSSLGLGMRA